MVDGASEKIKLFNIKNMEIEIFLTIVAAGFGLIIGSFLNCLLWRLHENEGITGRSYCPRCRQMIAWFDNIPLLSFIILRGRCRHCRKSISWQYPLVELATAVLFTLAFWSNLSGAQSPWLLVRDWLLIAALVSVFVYDFRWQMVPMLIVWPVGVAMFVCNLFLGVSWYYLLLAAACGAGFFLIQYLATRRRGVGEGDIWLGALLGLAFPSASQLLMILVVSYGIGAIVSLILLWSKKKKWRERIALGPFLSLGAIITLIWGESLLTWYLSFFVVKF
jgi:prepilin signal peptidase PulO-like enzyme (type II secretory pathway)